MKKKYIKFLKYEKRILYDGTIDTHIEIGTIPIISIICIIVATIIIFI